MEFTMTVVLGIVLTTLVAVTGDYLTKTRLARAATKPEELERLAAKVEALEKRTAEQEAKILLLEENVTFTTKLLEKSKN